MVKRPTWDQLREQRIQWGTRPKGVEEVRRFPTDAADAGRIPVGGDDMDPSETINGKLECAPAEVVMESDIRTQSLGQKCRVGDLHMAIAAEREV